MTFKESAVPAFLEIFESSKDLIRSYPGCMHLELLQDVKDKNVYSTYSWWGAQENLDDYRSSELFGKVWPKTKKLFSAPVQANSYEQKILLD